MIKVIDSLRYSDEHAPGNAATLYLIKDCFGDCKINVYFQKNHIDSVSQILEKNKIPLSNFNFKKVYGISNKGGPFKILLSYHISLLQDIRLLFLLLDKSNLIFYISANPLSIFFIKLVNLILHKNIIILIHGELESLNNENDRDHSFISNLFRIWYRITFWKLLNKKIKYLILGESIVYNLKEIKKKKFPENNFIAIDQPYFYTEGDNQCNNSGKEKKLSVGIVGHAAVAKGSHQIFELAKLMASEINENKISFRVIGNISDCMMQYKNDLVFINAQNNFMPRNIYEQEIRSLEYILFFYPDSMYKYISSGIFYDAISFEKPMLAINNNFLEYYFDRYGDIGYLCNNLNEMCFILKNFDYERYLEQVNNIKIAKKDLSIHKIAKKLYSQIEDK